MKKIVNISLMLLVCLTLVTGCGKSNKNKKEEEKKEDNKQVVEINDNQEIIKNQNIDGIEITNTSLIYEDGISYLKATVTNNTGADYELNEYKINIKDNEGNTIVTIPGFIGSILKNGESKPINTMISEDLSKAFSIEYEVVK